MSKPVHQDCKDCFMLIDLSAIKKEKKLQKEAHIRFMQEKAKAESFKALMNSRFQPVKTTSTLYNIFSICNKCA